MDRVGYDMIRGCVMMRGWVKMRGCVIMRGCVMVIAHFDDVVLQEYVSHLC